jgi:hypothetical protein
MGHLNEHYQNTAKSKLSENRVHSSPLDCDLVRLDVASVIVEGSAAANGGGRMMPRVARTASCPSWVINVSLAAMTPRPLLPQ